MNGRMRVLVELGPGFEELGKVRLRVLGAIAHGRVHAEGEQVAHFAVKVLLPLDVL